MVELKQLFSPEDVEVDFVCNNKEEAIAYAVEVMARNHHIPDPQRVVTTMLDREKLTSTGIGEGIAVPHGLCEGLSQTMMVVIRLKNPIEYGAPDEKPVDLLFCIAGPRDNTAYHLQLLSKLARILHNEQFRAALREAADRESLWKLIVSRE
ncbi:MAG: PTS sugar transporter subunit IIA [Treponemataceae bacterium]|nr:PTS sugar transporter subunit IIA [Treponemataceae bacterium]HOJ98744.1 PTS sugar transporter subunit IIA [Termitinemataceae bacterium]HOM23433.1 PTS sugar transporter subunit IIA [Termitinemataceae bacterium]HPQ00542.1 PTS sugar transporter subunit IIA [Termitinemataceae bacterium]